MFVAGYRCDTGLDDCQFEGSGFLHTVFLGYNADDVDYGFILPSIGFVFLVNDDLLYVFEPLLEESEIPITFQLITTDYVNETINLNDTDAGFVLTGADYVVLLKDYQIYLTDVSSSTHFLGDVTAPYLEENLEEDELPENFIISGR